MRQSEKLKKESQGAVQENLGPFALMEKPEEDTGPILIRPVSTLNDWVAIMMFRFDSGSIEMPEDQQYDNEGIVVGVGEGISDNAGGRLKPCVELGDVVMFKHNNIVMTINSNSPPYKGKRVVLISERNLLCKLPSVDWKYYEADE